MAAARPNLPKLAALWHAWPSGFPLRPVLLHTGQHHDAAMFGAHLADLGLPAPEISLAVSGGTHAALTGRTMIAAEAAWMARRPAWVVVAGDVDGTLAAALAARKLGIPVAHLEAGLRNPAEPDMPEEINRRAVDAIAGALWAPDEASAALLLAEGHPAARVRAVGNAMVDTALRSLPAARARPLPSGLAPGGYGVLTLHRAGNVDTRAAFAALLAGVAEAARRLPLVWPMHPRAGKQLGAHGLAVPPGVTVLPPLPYLDFLGLLARARLVASDSGGVQEESTVLDLPCLTMRAATERPATLEAGSSRLVPPDGLAAAVAEVLAGRWPRARPIPLWDGCAGARMAQHLGELLG